VQVLKVLFAEFKSREPVPSAAGMAWIAVRGRSVVGRSGSQDAIDEGCWTSRVTDHSPSTFRRRARTVGPGRI
jgi:hypothetical protein